MDIDIIVPYVDENDPDWKRDYEYYKELEVKQGIQQKTNEQAFATERTRDWDAFKFWFRGIEKNCQWVHKVFLVVQRESQIPKWLDKNHPKLRIVYHEEFIPKELLPTFSTLTIETFYYRIPDLSEYFIVSNDDFYFLNLITSNKFFKDGKVVQGALRKRPKKPSRSIWETIVNNNYTFLEKYIIKKPTMMFYHFSHLPDGRVKSFEINFMANHYDKIYEAMKISRFRHPKNLVPSLLFIESMKYTNFGILDENVYSKSKYVNLNATTDLNLVKDCEMACLNDTAMVGNDFEICKEKLIAFLEGKFPEKSSFELY